MIVLWDFIILIPFAVCSLSENEITAGHADGYYCYSLYSLNIPAARAYSAVIRLSMKEYISELLGCVFWF